MFIAFGVIVIVLLTIMIFAIATERFSPKEGIGCVVVVALVLLAFFIIGYLLVAHPDWYRFW
jgi:hypothetical protein